MNTPKLNFDFETLSPAAAGFDADRLALAVAFLTGHEIDWRRDLASADSLPGLTQLEPPPWNEIIGPLRDRGGPAGLIMRSGKEVARWGDIERCDMTFSVAKSYLALLAGLALGDGLIGSLDELVADRLAIAEFTDSPNNAITWRHLLTQSSEWRGTLFDKPDQVDHFRQLGSPNDNARKGELRQLATPGGFWEYNDVRVNVLSLALLHLFEEPLETVLRQRIMTPLGAGRDWQWLHYRNAMVEVNGQTLPSVPGGSHWGGGLWISARDHALVGQLCAQDGLWQGQRILPAGWVAEMWRPCALRENYGLLWWLNTGRREYPAMSELAVAAIGAGGHMIMIEPASDLVIVTRWLAPNHRNEALALIIAAESTS